MSGMGISLGSLEETTDCLFNVGDDELKYEDLDRISKEVALDNKFRGKIHKKEYDKKKAIEKFRLCSDASDTQSDASESSLDFTGQNIIPDSAFGSAMEDQFNDFVDDSDTEFTDFEDDDFGTFDNDPSEYFDTDEDNDTSDDSEEDDFGDFEDDDSEEVTANPCDNITANKPAEELQAGMPFDSSANISTNTTHDDIVEDNKLEVNSSTAVNGDAFDDIEDDFETDEDDFEDTECAFEDGEDDFESTGGTENNLEDDFEDNEDVFEDDFEDDDFEEDIDEQLENSVDNDGNQFEVFDTGDDTEYQTEDADLVNEEHTSNPDLHTNELDAEFEDEFGDLAAESPTGFKADDIQSIDVSEAPVLKQSTNPAPKATSSQQNSTIATVNKPISMPSNTINTTPKIKGNEINKNSNSGVKSREHSTKEFDSLSEAKLYELVKKYLILKRVNQNLVEIELLNKQFGANNIKKLIKKSYLIKLGNKVTIARGSGR